MTQGTLILSGVVVGLICAVLCYMIADRNNMSKVGWTIVGFLLGIIGLIITFIWAFIKTGNSNKNTV